MAYYIIVKVAAAPDNQVKLSCEWSDGLEMVGVAKTLHDLADSLDSRVRSEGNGLVLPHLKTPADLAKPADVTLTPKPMVDANGGSPA